MNALKLPVHPSKRSGIILLPVLGLAVFAGLVITANMQFMTSQIQSGRDLIDVMEEAQMKRNARIALTKLGISPLFRTPANSYTPSSISTSLSSLDIAVGDWRLLNVSAPSASNSGWSYTPLLSTNTPQASAPPSAVNFEDIYTTIFQGSPATGEVSTFYAGNAPLRLDYTLQNIDTKRTATVTGTRATVTEIPTGNFEFVSFGNFDSEFSNLPVEVGNGSSPVEAFIDGDLLTVWFSSGGTSKLTIRGANSKTVITGDWKDFDHTTPPSNSASFSIDGRKYFNTFYPNLGVNWGITNASDLLSSSGSVYVSRQSYRARAQVVVNYNTTGTGYPAGFTNRSFDGLPNALYIDGEVLAGLTQNYYYINAPTNTNVIIASPVTNVSGLTPIVIATPTKVTLRARGNGGRPIMVVTTNQDIRLLSAGYQDNGDTGSPVTTVAGTAPSGNTAWRGRLVLLSDTKRFNSLDAFNNAGEDWTGVTFTINGGLMVGSAQSSNTLMERGYWSNGTRYTGPLRIQILTDNTNYTAYGERFFHVTEAF